MSEAANETTIFQSIGGEAEICADVDRFYRRVLADPSPSHFFIGASMPRLKAHQFAFLSQSLGGPRQYNDQSMKVAHGRLATQKRHFDTVGVRLVETLRELGVLEEIVGQIAAAAAPLSAQLVHTPAQIT